MKIKKKLKLLTFIIAIMEMNDISSADANNGENDNVRVIIHGVSCRVEFSQRSEPNRYAGLG